MQLSDDGLALIEGFEGWREKLADGRFAAYQDTYHGKLDKPTIGPGCTEGVRMGMVWTRDECSAAFRKELAKHEAAVNRMITVEVSQHEFDGLMSLSYNVGAGAVERSTVLKKLNAGDKHGAAEAFKRFNRAGGAVVPGLVSRRAAEAAYFLKPDPDAPIAMPQTVTASPAPVTPVTAAVVASTAAGGLSQIPAPPDLSGLASWQAAGEQISAFVAFVASNPVTVAGIIMVTGAMMLIPKQEAS